MADQLIIKPELCIGCRSCELICAFNRIQEFSICSSAVSVHEFEGSAAIIPIMCMQCEDPACVKVCTVGALTKDQETGVVSINQDKCIVCKMCMNACPLGNISFDRARKVMVKCTLCDGDPMCAKVCPVGAISYVSSEDGFDRRDSLADKLNAIYGEGVV